jgi:hypothetical protein
MAKYEVINFVTKLFKDICKEDLDISETKILNLLHSNFKLINDRCCIFSQTIESRTFNDLMILPDELKVSIFKTFDVNSLFNVSLT